MAYLIKSKGKSKRAHIWTGSDTACRMWSTGGLVNKKSYKLHHSNEGLDVCSMCSNVTKRSTYEDPPELIRLVREIGAS